MTRRFVGASHDVGRPRLALSEVARAHLCRTVTEVRERIAGAARRGGRSPEAVRLVGVTKTVPSDWIVGLVQCGVTDLGENRPEDVPLRARAVAEAGLSVRWHMIGHYQRRKIRETLPWFSWVHSVHDEDLLHRLGPAGPAGVLRVPPRLLLQVNVSGEDTKQGFTPDALPAALDRARRERLLVAGLMTMAPFGSSSEQLREVFGSLRGLRDRWRDDALPLDELSMGMSEDFEIAVEEGATFVRIGSALFRGLER